jgi:hypothetical protein
MLFVFSEKMSADHQAPLDLKEVIAYSSLACSIGVLLSNWHLYICGSQNGTTLF